MHISTDNQLVRPHWREGPLADWLDAFADWAVAQGYAPSTTTREAGRQRSRINGLYCRDRLPEGGVEKSTLARMMAREFTADGLRTKIADLDTQQ